MKLFLSNKNLNNKILKNGKKTIYSHHFFSPLNFIKAQEKIVIHCKINLYKKHLSDTLNRLNIVFESAVRFADFDNKTSIQKLKSFEGSIASEDILKYMRLSGWRLIDPTNTKNIGFTFHFQKALNKSTN